MPISFMTTCPSSSVGISRKKQWAALICTGAYRHTETQTLLRDPGWQPLRDRRTNHKLILLYKITKGIYPKYLQDILPKQQQTHYTFRHQPHIPVYKTRLKSMANSFFPSWHGTNFPTPPYYLSQSIYLNTNLSQKSLLHYTTTPNVRDQKATG